jgi:hypothetical protein
MQSFHCNRQLDSYCSTQHFTVADKDRPNEILIKSSYTGDGQRKREGKRMKDKEGWCER